MWINLLSNYYYFLEMDFKADQRGIQQFSPQTNATGEAYQDIG
jgi:hypothetical protein